VHHDVEPAFAEILAQPSREPLDGEIALLLVALVLPHILGHVGQRVPRRVQRIDPLELQLPPVRQLQ
jgi:hypothetical protein